VLGPSNLLIDVGNTKLKYTWFDASTGLGDITSESIDIENLASLLRPDIEVFVCSVRSAQINQQIAEQLQSAKLKYQFAETQKQQFGIINSYKNEQHMGSDRWLAMLGADALVEGDVLVVDAGTAITCDFVIKKSHLGGWIAPGLAMLRKTVVNNTQRVFEFDTIHPEVAPGNDTANCVANGALAQIIGMTKQAENIMCSRSEQFSLVLTGGDREIVAQQLCKDNLSVIVHNNLVLAGLARLSVNKGN
jgi:type III pantothenate kinase